MKVTDIIGKLKKHKKNLRTHTIAVSARLLYSLAQVGLYNYACRYRAMSIKICFRDETLIDVTHLAEFHQIVGVHCILLRFNTGTFS